MRVFPKDVLKCTPYMPDKLQKILSTLFKINCFLRMEMPKLKGINVSSSHKHLLQPLCKNFSSHFEWTKHYLTFVMVSIQMRLSMSMFWCLFLHLLLQSNCFQWLCLNFVLLSLKREISPSGKNKVSKNLKINLNQISCWCALFVQL